MKEQFRLIKDKSELKGTCYFEFLRGPYRKKCWCDDSVFLSEGDFALIEDVFLRRVQGYDHFSFTEIREFSWRHILTDLRQIAAELKVAETARAIEELCDWVEGALQEHDCVSVLGM